MNVMIFAAGLGTRLKPLTDNMPKALVPVGGKPLLGLLIDKLKASVKETELLNVVINIHHFGQQIIDYIASEYTGQGCDIKFSDERDQLLETGGGLKKALPLFGSDEPVLVHNVDILSNIDLADFYNGHVADTDALVTMLVSERKTKRYLLFDDSDRLVGWTNIETGEVKSPYSSLNVGACRMYAYSGIQVVSPQLLPLMESWNGKFSIIDFYLSICDKVCIKCDLRTDLRLLDVGKIDSIAEAEKFVY